MADERGGDGWVAVLRAAPVAVRHDRIIPHRGTPRVNQPGNSALLGFASVMQSCAISSAQSDIESAGGGASAF